jgi:hypothetical protein
MKPQPPKSPLETPAPGDTQLIDLSDVELSVATALSAKAETAVESSRAAPPPLPPEAFAPPPSSVGAAAPARSTGFFVGAILVCLLIGVGGGIAVAMSSLRKPPASASPAASSGKSAPAVSGGKSAPAVITIPTVTVDDDPNSGR